MRFRHGSSTLDKIEMQMTPMIDIVFQLIIFFLLTGHLVKQETQMQLALPEAASGEQQDVLAAIKAGASGYLVKSASPTEILEAVLATGRGEAAQHAHGRIVSTLEGGYGLSALGRSVAEHIRELVAT